MLGHIYIGHNIHGQMSPSEQTRCFLLCCGFRKYYVEALLFFINIQMLQKDRSVRLGVKNDFKDIKGHVFFSPINWNWLDERKVKPPYNPNVVRTNGFS